MPHEKNRKKIILKPKTIENILRHRIKGLTLESIAPMYHLKSRQMVHKIIEQNRSEPRYKKLYEAMDATFEFLNRKI